MELQKLFVTLALKGDEFKQGLEDAGRQAEGLRSRIGGALGTAGRVAAGAMLGIGTAAVAGFGLAMKSAIGMNASLEQSTMQFTTLMGDADMAAEHVAMLFELGAKTPFETGPIIAASKHLQVFGGAALNTQENLIMIGDAAAAVGAPFDEVAFWTGRMYSAIQGGQPFGEAAMRLQELGLLTPEVRTEMEGLQQSGAAAGEVWGAMAGQLGTFTGAMEMQATSWAGITSTLSDTLQMMAANALAPFFELAKQGVQGLSDLLNSPEIQAGIALLAEKLTVIIQAIADFVTGLTNGQSVATTFGELAFRLAEAFGATRQEAVQVYIAVKTFVAQVMSIVEPIASAVLQFVSFKDVLIALGLLIMSVVIPAVVSLVLSMAPILLTIAAVIAVVALLRNAWENNWGGIQEKTKAVIDFIVPLVKNAIEGIKEWWAENGGRIVAQAKADLEALRDGFVNAIDYIKQVVSLFLDNLQRWWAQNGEIIVDTVTRMWDLIVGLFEGVTKQLNLIGEAFRLLFAGEWEKLGEKLFEIWETAWTTVVDFLKGLWGMILPWLTEMWDSIKTWFSIMDWGGLGRDIINGIVNGLRSAGSAIVDVIKGFVTAAWDAVKAFFGIASPSKLMYWAGQMIVEGFVKGIESRSALVDGAIDATLIDPFTRWMDMMAFGDKAGSIAGGFAGHFQRTVLDPMEGRLDVLQGTLDDRMPGIAERWQQLTGMAMMDWNDRGQLDAVLSSLYRLQRGVMPGSALAADVQASIDAMTERNDLEHEYIRQQERLLALEQARSDLDFLKQQMELLGLMRDNNIPLAALGGLELGLTADPGALMDAMVTVMETIVRDVQYDLNNAFNQSPAMSSPTPGTGGASTMNVQTQNINGGQHIYLYDAEESELEQLGVLIR